MTLYSFITSGCLSYSCLRIFVCGITRRNVSKGKTMRVLYPVLTEVQVENCAVGVQTQARILCLEGVPHSSPPAGVLSLSGQSAAVAHVITMGLCEHSTAMREPSTSERVGGWGGQRREQVPPGAGGEEPQNAARPETRLHSASHGVRQTLPVTPLSKKPA